MVTTGWARFYQHLLVETFVDCSFILGLKRCLLISSINTLHYKVTY